MATRRVARVSQAILETVSTIALFQLRDPRIKNVSVLRAEVSGDMRSAKVFVAVRGSDRDRALCLQGLDSARGFLQKKVADRIQTRFTPILKFVLEDETTAAAQATRILDELAMERGEAEAEDDETGQLEIQEAEDIGELDEPETTPDAPVAEESED